MDAELIGIKVEKARKAAGMTQEQLARSIGVNRRSIWRIERGDADSVSFGAVSAALEVLGLQMEVASAREPGEPAFAKGYTKPCCVVDEWQDLRGADSGSIELPVSVYWQGGDPNPSFDVADDRQCAKAYGALLADGTRRQIAKLVNPRRLADLWPRLRLPSGVRRAWSERYPQELTGGVANA